MDRSDGPGAGVVVRPVLDPRDPALPSAARLLAATFADPDVVLGLDRLREFVAEPGGADRSFHMLVATAEAQVVGVDVSSYMPAANCGFTEYIALAREHRGGGLSRRLHEARRALLDERARHAGAAACHGLFLEAESPERTPSAIVEAERATALDVRERLGYFAHLGFRRVDVHYVQPPLGPHKQPVTYLDLLFLSWDADVRASGRLPSTWLRAVLEPTWRRWSPATAMERLAALAGQLDGRPDVALLPLE